MNSHRRLLPECVLIVVQLYSTKRAAPLVRVVGIVGVDKENAMKVYVDASPSKLVCMPDTPEVSRTRPIPHYEVLVSPHTHNEAEYLAVIKALKEFPDVDEIFSDSQLVVNQLNGEWTIKEQRLFDLAEEVWNLVSYAQEVKFTWIPRKQNLAGRLLG